MDIAHLIESLRDPAAYPEATTSIEIRQTHISVVALTDRHAYKVKKPLDLGFLDFTTLEKRRHFCEEEVRLNRRLAPDVYLGVVPIVASDGGLRVGAEGSAIEFAVKMRRLPDRATLGARLQAGDLAPETLAELGRRVARFHEAAASSAAIDQYGRWDVVAGNARENLEQSRAHIGECLSMPVFGRLEKLLEERLRELRPLVEARAGAHRPRDTHGDLHLEHVYLFPERAPPGDLVAIDCVEFNERFRFSDPVSDMAFLVMDLLFHGRRDLADVFAEAYFAAAEDEEGRNLLPFYVAYRAAVRGKVEGMVAGETEVPGPERRAAVRRARAHWLLALSELEEARHRPCMVLVGGLPGTGKTTLAESLAREAGFRRVSSDEMRKRLAGLAPGADAGAAFGEGIYTQEWNDRTYDACLDRARELLFGGERVIVDASFREAGRRRAFLEAAVALGVRGVLLLCTASPKTVKRRLAARRSGPSDADWSVYRAAVEVWEPEGPTDPRWTAHEVPTDGTPEDALVAALAHLRTSNLVEVSDAIR